MGTLGLCPLELSGTVLLGQSARGGPHNRDARLPRLAGQRPVGGAVPAAQAKRAPTLSGREPITGDGRCGT
jgi:hypothetical protein